MTTFIRGRRTCRPGLIVLGCALALGIGLGAVGARADNLDLGLRKQARKVMEDLKQRGYKNVGVLTFRVKKRGREFFNVGPINVNMASRLENALALINDSKKPVGITHNATRVANRKKHLTYLTPRGRATLFKQKYPLAWGNQSVPVDAFLTGMVTFTANMRETSIRIEAFDRKNASKLRKVAEFQVPTDRSILSDMGRSFVLAKRGLRGRGPDDQDIEAVNNTNKPQGNNKIPVELKIFAGQEPLDYAADSNNNNKEQKTSREFRDGEVIRFTLKANQRVGVALRVNGRNTTVESESDMSFDQYTRWILKPNVEYSIKGFYNADGKGVKLFKVLSDDESKSTEMSAETKGLIQMDVWVEGDGSDENDDMAKNRSLRGPSRREWKKKKPRTLSEFKAQIYARASRKRAKPRGLLSGGDEGTADVKTSDFKNPKHVGNVVIRYYRERPAQNDGNQ